MPHEASFSRMGARVSLPDEWSNAPFSRAEAVGSGFSDKRIRSRALARPFHGVRSQPEQALEVDGLCRAWFVKPTARGVVAGATAMQLFGLPVPSRLAGSEIEIAVKLSSRSRPKDRNVAALRVNDRMWNTIEVDGIPVLHPVVAWATLARRLNLKEAVVLGDALVTSNENYPGLRVPRPIATLEELEQVSSLMGSAPGVILVRHAVPRVRERVASRMETELRLLLEDSGLPGAEVNAVIRDEAGAFLAEGDLVYRQQRVVVEYQGDHHRTDPRQFQSDVRRRRRLNAAGWTVVEVTIADIRKAPGRVVNDVRRALDAGGAPTR